MANVSLGFSPLLLTQFLFWGLLAAAALMAATDRYIRATIRQYRLYALLAIVVTLVWRFPKGGVLFLGMEYEDSYVYTVVARQMLEGNHVVAGMASYLTTVCDVGSLRACQAFTTYSGHYIGEPYL